MSTKGKLIAGVAMLVVLTVLWFLVPVRELIEGMRDVFATLGALGVALYVALFVVTTVALGPTWALTVVGGLVYGLWGIPLAVLGATLGACAVLLLGRGVARERVRRLVTRDERLEALSHAVDGRQGWKIVGLLNLSPVVPFGLQNYALSVTGIRLVPFAFATCVGVVPGAVLYAYLGSLGRVDGEGGGGLRWTLLALGLAATVAVTWLVARRARATLAKLELDR